MHFDGARLWECTAALRARRSRRSPPLADSVYVSFYKSLGGISGAALAGPADADRGGRGLAPPVRRSAVPAVARRRSPRWPVWTANCRGCRRTWRMRRSWPRRCARACAAAGRALVPGAPGGAAHPPVPGVAAVSDAECWTRRGCAQAEETGTTLFRQLVLGAGGPPGLAGHGGDGGRARAGLDGGGGEGGGRRLPGAGGVGGLSGRRTARAGAAAAATGAGPGHVSPPRPVRGSPASRAARAAAAGACRGPTSGRLSIMC